MSEKDAKASIQTEALAAYSESPEVDLRPRRGMKRRTSDSNSSSHSSRSGDTSDDDNRPSPAQVAKNRSADRAKKQRTADAERKKKQLIADAAAKTKQAKDEKAASVFPFPIDAVDRDCSFVNLLTLMT
jgi:hypothetical protein